MITRVSLWIDSQGMDDTRNVTQYRQEDVDEEVGIASALEENTEGWEENREDDLADIAVESLVSAIETTCC